jgi:hypothetical protein
MASFILRDAMLVCHGDHLLIDRLHGGSAYFVTSYFKLTSVEQNKEIMIKSCILST